MLMKKEKKSYTKPVLKKNEPLVNITFATGAVGTTAPGTVTITGGAPASGAAAPT
jgi:hypothetical protein